ncbi:cytochrome o ubiquinol oxidase subunit III [Candidatus Palibaumannia cicadellinicola]|uniref:Cytochrome bo(3) ubiquinol oxidase subunit 3 n=1 Tax=Baumannia cicadellinicola subsp. Homalodisca coagulata TaxID=374463 RepID=Q1LTJ5_BAUCH|nr:cytochrome o ubiquinol oxidase subunit III [Candidatus Baumannia cicadellinicola]ABF14210.1 cytochrome o ubiquinol oxidase, subunit III [Baumannia cicadellinicola str. Hc (Homalodisca coagulata)]MBS0032712.1 cytochrome o ubiquinol oxidase subunit III [Candidatus Baumannia cicadellinicola]MCJ7462298.1 cytochrome o ubiquinol oxidase subunit III [Candidatus Baumannia cicadellinicola]MCJ7462818.1 cytochrome o ubiquinol oxidase subunit III [Candidatus Baumannia cicadellinicola]
MSINNIDHINTSTLAIVPNTEAKKILGFWIYLMSDCILFAMLFATYVVLSHSIAGGPSGKEIFELPAVQFETFCLLLSSLTYGIAILAMYRKQNNSVILWLFCTFILGLGFIIVEIMEFYNLIINGFGPNRSAFLSGFFSLVATHGCHVISGLIWIMVMIVHVYKKGLTLDNQIRLQCLSLFWHFLDIIWICVFTVVYLLGVL